MKLFAPFLMTLTLCAQPVFAATLGSDAQQAKALKEHTPLIQRTLKKIFQISDPAYYDVKMVAGGFSKADLFIISLKKGPKAPHDLIVKIMKDSPRDDIVTEAFATKIAGDTGVGPQFHYADVDQKMILRDAVPNLHNLVRQDTPFHLLVADKIKKFHNASPLNRTVLFFDILRQDAQRLVDHDVVDSFSASQHQKDFKAALLEVEALFSHFKDDIKPVHHDLSPHNVMYGPASKGADSEAWLIDWETASNDYYSIDLCMFANFHIFDDAKLPAFMEAYYGCPPTELEMAKFHAIRPFCFGFHGLRLAFLSNMKQRPSLETVEEYTDFQLGIRRGEIELGSPLSLYRLAVSTMNKAHAMLQGDDYKRSIAYLKQHIKGKTP